MAVRLALEPGFGGALAYIDVVLSVVQHAVDQGRQLPRDGEDGHHAQDGRDTDGAGAVGLLPGQGLAPGDGGSRGQAQPADEVLFGGEGGQVEADFGEDGLRRAGTAAVDAGEIDSGEAPQGGPDLLLSPTAHGLLLARVGMARHRLLAALLRFESPDLLQQACLVGGDPFLDVVVQLQRRLKVEVATEWWTVEVAADATTEQLCAVVSDPSSPRGAVMSIRVSRQS